jgi:hypothetical protein
MSRKVQFVTRIYEKGAARLRLLRFVEKPEPKPYGRE